MASTSRTVKVKFDGDAKGLAAAAKEGEREVDKLSKSTDHLSSSMSKATKVSDDHANALGRLRVAQLRQAEVQKRSNPSAAAVAAAEEAVRSAERAVKKFEKSGDDSGKGFVTGLKKWFSPSSLGKAGQEGGTVFGSGFLGALKTPVLGPAIAGALTAAVAVAAPAAGSIAASGLVLAFGAGLAGLGLVTAAKTKPVQDTWSKTLDKMGSDTTKLSKPFESTLVSIAGFAQRTFAKFAPSLEAVFKEMAPAVTKFTDQVAKGLERLQPAVRPIAEGFDAVLASLGPATQSAIGNVSAGMVKLAESVKQNPDGLSDLVAGLGGVTEKTLGVITALNNLNGKFSDLTGGTSAVDVIFGKANSKIGQFLGYIRERVDPLSGLKNGLDLLAGSANKATTAIGLTGDAAKYFTQGLTQAQAAAIITGKSVDGTRSQFDRQKAATDALTATYNRQKSATDALISSLFRLQGLALGLSGAQIAYQQSVDDATASIKENGRTLDINTEKGRNNKSALNAVAQAANQQTQSMIESNKGTAAAAKTAEASRANFIHLATQMGLSKTEAAKLATQMIAIPNVSRTAKLQANKADLETKLAAAKKQLADPHLTATKKAQLRAEIKNLEDGIAEAQRLLAGLPKTKTVNVVTKYTTVGSRSSGSGVGGGHEIPGKGNAAGGLIQPRTRRWVGERGPEILEMGNEGGRILSAEQIGAALAGGGSQPMTAEIHIEIGGEVVRVVRTEIKANDRNTTRRKTAGVRV